MAAERKLKSEIDRTLKKVQEGQDIFEDLWNQVHESENQNQREKLEAELKKEIKKLQRLREQIKAWIAGADIKDKQPLMDARKSIERDMERFKACEKEAKMKGGIGGGKTNDPKEKAKEDARDWINNTVDSLTGKVEEMEYEVEELQGAMKKKQKPPARLTELDELVARHKEHVLRLEKVLRCIDNETIQPEELEDLKNDMESYLSQDEDAGIDFTNVDDMYASLSDRMEAVDAVAPAPTTKGGHGSKGMSAKEREAEAERERERHEKERERERAAAAAAKAQLIAQAGAQASHLIQARDDHHEEAASTAAPAALPPGGLAALVAGGGAAGAQGRKTPGGPAVTPAAAAGKGAQAGARSAAPAATPTKAAASAGAPPAAAPEAHPAPPEPGPPATSGQVTPAGAPSTPRTTAQQAATTAPSPAPSMEPPSPAVARAGQPAAYGQGAPGFSAAAGPGPGAAVAAAAARQQPGGPGVNSWLAATTGNGVEGPGAGPGTAAQAGPAAGTTAAAAQQKAFTAKLQQGTAAAGGVGAAGAKSGQPGSATAAAGKAGGKEGELPFPPEAVAAPVVPDGKGPVSAQEVDALAAQMAAAKGLSLGSMEAADREALLRAAAATVAAGGQGVMNPEAGGQAVMAPLQPAVPAFSIPAAKQILEGCFSRALPQPSDMDWKRYKPRHPATVPASYPRAPHEVIDNPMLFRKVDPEVLFFAFYFQPDTYQQYLAAHELKRQSWRFHKHHYAWFQRFTEPTVTSEEYEQGAYVYFDYNIVHDDMQTGWCYRRKENFTFRYDALEDELRVQQ